MDTEVQRLRSIFSRNEGRTLLIDEAGGTGEYSYGEVMALSLRAAELLSQEDVGSGDGFVMQLPNSVEHVVLYFAAMHLGALPAPVNQELGRDTKQKIVDMVDHDLAITEGDLPGTSDPVRVTSSASTDDEGDSLLHRIKGFERRFETPFPDREDEETALMVFTSGTTGRPKGVMYPFELLTRRPTELGGRLEMHRDMRTFNYHPLPTAISAVSALFVPVMTEGSVVIESVFGPELASRYWDVAARNDVSSLVLTPGDIAGLIEAGGDASDADIEMATFSGGPASPANIERFEEMFETEIYQLYGTAEVPYVTSNGPGLSKRSGAGPPLESMEVYVLDERGNESPRGESGRIIVEPEEYMNGYYNLSEEVENPIENGVYRTGDLGFLDEDGFLHISGRDTDMIIKGGTNISPKAVEDTLAEHPEVIDAAVFGVEDPDIGERVVAAVQVEDEVREGELEDHCRQRLQPLKVPDRIHLVETLPRTSTGKVMKRELRKRLEEDADG